MTSPEAESNACGMFASKACHCATGVHASPSLCDLLNAKDKDMEKRHCFHVMSLPSADDAEIIHEYLQKLQILILKVKQWLLCSQYC